MIRGTALVLALAVVAGCGSSGTKPRRDAVNSYFADLTTAQIGLLSKEGQIDSTLKRFSLAGATPLELARLRSARRDVADALRRTRALHPPSDARKLQALIVQRLALQRSVVDELIAAAVYIPKLAATTPALGAASAGLRRDLAAITSSPRTTVKPNGTTSVLDRYAAAFGGYGDALVPVSATLDGLTAPPILRPTLEAERAGVKRSVVLCSAIRRALHRRDIPAANAAIHSLFTVSSALNGPSTRKQQAAAARAYDARLTQINTLARKASLERARLVRVIG